MLEQFTGVRFSISDFVEEKTKLKQKSEEDELEDLEGESKDGQEEMEEEEPKDRPKLAVFKCVGIGLKNNSREMA